MALLLLLVCGLQVESLVSLGWCIHRGTRGQGDRDADNYLSRHGTVGSQQRCVSQVHSSASMQLPLTVTGFMPKNNNNNENYLSRYCRLCVLSDHPSRRQHR